MGFRACCDASRVYATHAATAFTLRRRCSSLCFPLPRADGSVWRAQPRALTAARGGVGAVVWDGALVLTAYLASQPADRFRGAPPPGSPETCP